jgi:hypothetical protein
MNLAPPHTRGVTDPEIRVPLGGTALQMSLVGDSLSRGRLGGPLYLAEPSAKEASTEESTGSNPDSGSAAR